MTAEIVQLLADGLPNKQIARRLGITDATVKNHVHNILEKLDVSSRGAAAACYRRTVSLTDASRVGLDFPTPSGRCTLHPAL